jgi:hypothetical protein
MHVIFRFSMKDNCTFLRDVWSFKSYDRDQTLIDTKDKILYTILYTTVLLFFCNSVNNVYLFIIKIQSEYNAIYIKFEA